MREALGGSEVEGKEGVPHLLGGVGDVEVLGEGGKRTDEPTTV